mgnify:CR=1 FL=1
MGYIRRWLLCGSKTPTFGDFAFLAFVLAQYLDGLLTYFGVTRGIAAEDNSLAFQTMSVVGVGATVMLFKLASVGLGVLFYPLGNRLGNHHIVPVVLASLTVVVIIRAVAPWAYLFLTL